MAQWRITRGEEQFTAADMNELKAWADGGKIRPDDIVLHPDLGRHLYAVELDEIGPVLSKKGNTVDDDDFDVKKKRGVSPAVYNSLVGLTLIMFLGVCGAFVWAAMNRPDPDATTIYDPKDPGVHGSLKAEEALVTDQAKLRLEPRLDAPEVAKLPEGKKVVLKAKSGKEWYRVETADGKSGYLAIAEVVPGYFFDKQKRKELDPIFNPDRYIKLVNYSWAPNYERGAKANETLFMFTLENTSRYPMDSVILEITLMDADSKIVDVQLVPIQAEIPPSGVLMSDELPFEVDYKKVPNARVRVLEARAFIPSKEGAGSDKPDNEVDDIIP